MANITARHRMLILKDNTPVYAQPDDKSDVVRLLSKDDVVETNDDVPPYSDFFNVGDGYVSIWSTTLIATTFVDNDAGEEAALHFGSNDEDAFLEELDAAFRLAGMQSFAESMRDGS